MQTPRECLAVNRMRHAVRKCLVLCFTAFLLSASLSGCLESTEPVEQIFPLFIQPTDLPSGWYYDKTGAGIGQWDNEGQGIVSRYATFRGTRDRDLLEVHVTQELVLFPDASQAINAFAVIAEKEAPTENWIWPEQVRFESGANQFHLACVDLERVFADIDQEFVESYWCTAVGQYGTVVSIISANIFEDQWLTFDDFQRLLTMTDARLAGAASLKQP